MMGSSSRMPRRQSERPPYLEWLRLLSSYLILTYGTRKLIGTGQFAFGHTLINRPIGRLSGFELTWFYYGYSHEYGVLLGLTQVFGGVLLLFRRSALLGAAVLTPVMTNILMINIFFHIALGAEIVSAFILISVLLLLWQERFAIFEVFWAGQSSDAPFGSRAEKIAAFVVVLLVLVEVTVFARYAAR